MSNSKPCPPRLRLQVMRIAEQTHHQHGVSGRYSRALRRWLVFVLAALAVTACGHQESRADSQDASSTKLVQLFTTLTGGPVTEEGARAPTATRMTAADDAGESVRFDADWVQRNDGELSEIEVSPDQHEVILYLAEGRRFTLAGRAYDDAMNLLAYGESERVTTTGTSSATTLHLTTLLGDLLLIPRLPTNYVVPGQVLDLVLVASPPERADLRVPHTQFSATYALNTGTVMATTTRGVRLSVGGRGGTDFTASALATGLVTQGGAPVPGEVTAQFTMPFLTETMTDLNPPVISDLAFDDHQLIFTGVADDNVALAFVELYDGPARIASTEHRWIEAGVPEIHFPGGGTAFTTRLGTPPLGPTLTVIAVDHAGNEASLDLPIDDR